ncbi:unnamed protein product [Spirodela intermedia]|uniref:Uncharacterized protein n=1 Tax=Spirodela intermedia TaxID=51605 RepID=A0A7I8L7X7_SPIIN|nr:unnamed protein product [Spirodela intermedia]
MDAPRVQAGRRLGLINIHGVFPARLLATYPKVDHALVTRASAVLRRYISANAFTSCASLPVCCCSSWLGWWKLTFTPVDAARPL